MAITENTEVRLPIKTAIVVIAFVLGLAGAWYQHDVAIHDTLNELRMNWYALCVTLQAKGVVASCER